MKDLITKGFGNSRKIKSAVPTNSTLQEIINLLRSGEFPIDFAGLYPDGILQMGTPLNKANLLTDETAERLIGSRTGNETPEQAFAAIASRLAHVEDSIRVAYGSYAGTGVSGAGSPNSITLNWPARFLFVTRQTADPSGAAWIIMIPEAGGFWGTGFSSASQSSHGVCSLSGNTVQWYATYPSAQYDQVGGQMNSAGRTYRYIAIG